MSGRFRAGVIWNLAAFGILAISGLLLNVLIGRYYGPATFGVFTQVLAYYYIFSQLAVGGLGYSTVSLSARYVSDPVRLRGTVLAALSLTFLLAAGSTSAAFLLSTPIGSWTGSADVGAGIRWSLPGLVCFALNKVLLFALNGLGHMRAHAVFTAARYMLIIVVLTLLIATDASAPKLALALSAGELVLFPALAIYAAAHRIVRIQGIARADVRDHLDFGLRSFFTPLLQDATSKVDVLVLGLFAGDATVGIYAFAAMLAIEGAYQLLYVVQINLSPMLSTISPQDRAREVPLLFSRATRYLVPVTLAVGVIGTALFPWVAELLTNDAAFSDGWRYFAVILAGLTIAAARLPFGVALNQWGLPGAFFTLAMVQIVSNTALNFALVPIWSSMGSAVGTALSYVIAAGYVHLAVTRAARA